MIPGIGKYIQPLAVFNQKKYSPEFWHLFDYQHEVYLDFMQKNLL